MVDLDLRTLERDALASGDSVSWKCYYGARRRLGQGLPSGEVAYAFDFHGPCRLIRIMATMPSLEDRESIIRDVELEWRRCGTGVPVRLIVDDLPFLTCGWRDTLSFPSWPFVPADPNYPHGYVTVAANAIMGMSLGSPDAQGLEVRRRAVIMAPEFLNTPGLVVHEDSPVIEFIGPAPVVATARTYYIGGKRVA